MQLHLNVWPSMVLRCPEGARRRLCKYQGSLQSLPGSLKTAFGSRYQGRHLGDLDNTNVIASVYIKAWTCFFAHILEGSVDSVAQRIDSVCGGRDFDSKGREWTSCS